MEGWAMVDSPVFTLYVETYRRRMYSTNISSALQRVNALHTHLLCVGDRRLNNIN